MAAAEQALSAAEPEPSAAVVAFAAVEAQAAGCPVIAYKGGGALETVVEGRTGLFFAEQSSVSMSEAVHRFEDIAHCFRANVLADHAQKFSKVRFLGEFRGLVENNS